jgi:excisionase family DNA binding protein
MVRIGDWPGASSADRSHLESGTGVVTITTNANGRTEHRRLGPQRNARQAAAARWREARSRPVVTGDHEAAIRAATDALAAAILAAVRAEAASNDARPEQLLSIDRAAVVAGVGRTTIYAAIGAGRLRSVKVGRRRLVSASAIAELAAAEQDARVRPGRAKESRA